MKTNNDERSQAMSGSKNWRMPGQNFTIDVDGKVVTIKPLTDIQRKEISKKIVDTDENSDVDIRGMLSDVVVSIEGVDGDIGDILSHQPSKILIDILQKINMGSTLSDDESKN